MCDSDRAPSEAVLEVWRGFKTIPAFPVSFSVSFFKHGANLGFQFCLPTKCSIQKCPGAFSSGVASTSLKWRGGVGKFHLSSIQKMLKKEHLTKCEVNRCSPKAVCKAENKTQLPSLKASFLHPARSKESFCIVRDLQQVHQSSNVEYIFCSLKVWRETYFWSLTKSKPSFMIPV